jgi:aspartate aminotransferase
MYPLSEVLSRVKMSATSNAGQRAQALRAAGRDVIVLTSGEPDFPTPENIRNAASRAMEAGYTKYSLVGGVPEFRDAIAQKFQRENNLKFSRDEIIVSNGGKQVLANAMIATLNPGDEVIIAAPYWVSYPEQVALCGGIPVIVSTSEATGFKLSPSDLEQAIKPKTKWIVLNSPSNPSGSISTFEELRALGEVVERNPHVWVVTDDIYEHILYDGRKFATFASANPQLANRTLTVNGLSKAYAMTCWRIGYAGGPRELIKAMTTIQSQLTGGAGTISQWAGVEALMGTQVFLEKNRAVFQARRNLVCKLLKGARYLTCRIPEGSFYLFPSCAEVIGRKSPSGKVITSDSDFVDELLEVDGVGLVAGSAFGADNHFRISYAASEKQLTQACERIVSFCEKL